MNENHKIDINGSVNDAIKEAGQTGLGIMVVALIIGALVAPIFAPLWESGLKEKYRSPYGYPDYEMVEKQMVKVKIALWIFAGFAWLGLILANVCF